MEWAAFWDFLAQEETAKAWQTLFDGLLFYVVAVFEYVQGIYFSVIGPNWDILLRFYAPLATTIIAALTAFLLAKYQFNSRRAWDGAYTRNNLKTDLEIRNLMNDRDPGLQLVNKRIYAGLEQIYVPTRRSLGKVYWGLVISGLVPLVTLNLYTNHAIAWWVVNLAAWSLALFLIFVGFRPKRRQSLERADENALSENSSRMRFWRIRNSGYTESDQQAEQMKALEMRVDSYISYLHQMSGPPTVHVHLPKEIFENNGQETQKASPDSATELSLLEVPHGYKRSNNNSGMSNANGC